MVYHLAATTGLILIRFISSPPVSRGRSWTQTLDLGMMMQAKYHCASAAGLILNSFISLPPVSRGRSWAQSPNLGTIMQMHYHCAFAAGLIKKIFYHSWFYRKELDSNPRS
jgi:hypothetical protein